MWKRCHVQLRPTKRRLAVDPCGYDGVLAMPRLCIILNAMVVHGVEARIGISNLSRAGRFDSCPKKMNALSIKRSIRERKEKDIDNPLVERRGPECDHQWVVS